MKAWIALSLAVIMLVCMAGCGTGETPSDTGSATTQATTAVTTQATTESAAPQVYDALAEFSTEQVENGVWFYGYTDDGMTNKLAGVCKPTESGDADYWYCGNDTYVGINRGFEGGEGWLELVNNGETGSAGVGFVAPADGTYTFSGKTWNKNGDASSGILINCWDQQLEILPFTTEPTEYSVTVGLEAGDVAFFWAADEYNWVTAYLTIQVEAVLD